MVINRIRNLGYVPSSLFSIHEDKEYFERHGFSLGFAQVTFNPYSKLPRAAHLKGVLSEGISLVVHAPYFICLARQDKTSEKSIKILNLVYDWASEMQAVAVVTHIGYRGVVGKFSISRDSARRALITNITSLLPRVKETGILLHLENTAGSLTGYPFGYLDDIEYALNRFDRSNVSMVFDTCHAFVSGDSSFSSERDFGVDLNKYVRMIHLNPSDEKAPFASCRDRHSSVAIADSVHLSPNVLKDIYESNLDIPVILERGNRDIVVKDVRYLLGLM